MILVHFCKFSPISRLCQIITPNMAASNKGIQSQTLHLIFSISLRLRIVRCLSPVGTKNYMNWYDYQFKIILLFRLRCVGFPSPQSPFCQSPACIQCNRVQHDWKMHFPTFHCPEQAAFQAWLLQSALPVLQNSWLVSRELFLNLATLNIWVLSFDILKRLPHQWHQPKNWLPLQRTGFLRSLCWHFLSIPFISGSWAHF